MESFKPSLLKYSTILKATSTKDDIEVIYALIFKEEELMITEQQEK